VITPRRIVVPSKPGTAVGAAASPVVSSVAPVSSVVSSSSLSRPPQAAATRTSEKSAALGRNHLFLTVGSPSVVGRES
jgi:hypothetical protein